MANGFDINNFLPRHTRKLVSSKNMPPVSTGHYYGKGLVLDKNESAWGTVGIDADYSRYPDSQASTLRKELAEYYKIDATKITVGNGSDELIDLILRSFCTAGKDRVLTFAPYEARLKHFTCFNNLILDEVPLNSEFQLSIFQARAQVTEHTKILFLSNPNPISGISLRNLDIVDLIDDFNGLVVIDESYIGYESQNSLVDILGDYPNVIILHSFSNVWGMAGLRLGVAFASPQIIDVLNKVKAPFSVNAMAQEVAIKALRVPEKKDRIAAATIAERERLKTSLLQLKFVQEVYASDANFLLVRVEKPELVFQYLKDEYVAVFDASQLTNCQGCLRITVGVYEQNERLLKGLRDMSAKTAPGRLFLKNLSKTLQKASVFLGFFKKIVG